MGPPTPDRPVNLVLGLYLYRVVTPRRRVLPIWAGLIASVLGHSTWIGLVVFMILPLFGLYQIGLVWRQAGFGAARQMLGGYAIVALGAGLIILPFALTLVGNGTAQAGVVFEIPHNLSDWPLLSPFSSRFPDSVVAQLLDVPPTLLDRNGSPGAGRAGRAVAVLAAGASGAAAALFCIGRRDQFGPDHLFCGRTGICRVRA